MKEQKKWNICMVSDFFYPQFGGVESHIYNLANCFIQRGHKVIVLTKATDNRSGIRYMSKNLLKVYYIPLFMVKSSYGIDTVPTLFCNISIYRNIFIREKIDIVHGHQSSSTMAHESCYAAMLMGIKTVITDHSLFGFDGLLEIHFNKGLQFSNMLIDHFISVSNTGKQNYILRTELKPKYWDKISVIPNAIDSSSFQPLKEERKKTERIIIVIVARLVYRKGVTLLKDIIPQICLQHPNVDFLIGGDGALKYLLEQTIENNYLYDRVKLLGAVPSDDVRDILVKGDIFLNCSLTEAFGISILEAASCGLLIVSTKVGGVYEILPGDMMNLVEPKVMEIVNCLSSIISNFSNYKLDRYEMHEKVKKMYSWNNICDRTEKVYERINNLPKKSVNTRISEFLDSNNFSIIFGLLLCLFYLIMVLSFKFIETFQDPEDEIDIAIDKK